MVVEVLVFIDLVGRDVLMVSVVVGTLVVGELVLGGKDMTNLIVGCLVLEDLMVGDGSGVMMVVIGRAPGDLFVGMTTVGGKVLENQVGWDEKVVSLVVRAPVVGEVVLEWEETVVSKVL